MAFRLVDDDAGIEIELSAATLHGLMEAACEAFTASLTRLDTVEPRQAEELEVDAPDLETLLADCLSELLYRFDARRWLTRFAEIEVHEKDGGWSLEGTLRGERHEPHVPSTHPDVGGITLEGLRVVRDDGGDGWTARVRLARGPEP